MISIQTHLRLSLLDETTVPVLIDMATFAHLGALAAGLGAVIFADSTILSRVTRRTNRRQMAIIDHAHHTITIALVLLWASGLSLLGLKAGFNPANFSPKLITKLGTVSVLTVTAIAMARFALPYMRANIGRRLVDAPLADQCLLALCVGMSAAGWGTSLLLGSSKILKTAGDEVMLIGAGMHGLAVAGALAMAIAVHALQRSRERFDQAAWIAAE
jgi:hypothetical protein